MGILDKVKSKAKQIGGEIKHDAKEVGGLIEKGREAYKKYEAAAPERRKKHIQKLKHETQTATLEAQKLQAQNRLKKLRGARYSGYGEPTYSGAMIGGQIGNTGPKKLKPKKRKKKKAKTSRSITINL